MAKGRRSDDADDVEDDVVVVGDDEDLDEDLVEVGIGAGLDEDLDDDVADPDAVPEGFLVVGEDDVADDADVAPSAPDPLAADDGARAVAVIEAAGRGVSLPGDEDGDDEDGFAVRRDGEFVCSRCHLVKRDTQLARPRLRICRDCA